MLIRDIHPAWDWVDGREVLTLTGETVDYDGSGGEPGDERACIPTNANSRAEPQVCPVDGGAFDCLDDYIGGGSHYWVLQCRTCSDVYTFDTYRFELEFWHR